MSQTLERRITEWAEWYHNNHDRIPKENLVKRCEFLEIVVDGMIEIVAIAAKDIQRLEGRGGDGIRLPGGGLILPLDYRRL